MEGILLVCPVTILRRALTLPLMLKSSLLFSHRCSARGPKPIESLSSADRAGNDRAGVSRPIRVSRKAGYRLDQCGRNKVNISSSNDQHSQYS